jgi:tRNA1(Val) A37 N6-methylase TrmN6
MTQDNSLTPVPRGLYFDSVAGLYDKVRIGYPAALFKDILSYGGEPPVKRVLEIGCGTGQATIPLAQAGIALICIEPGTQLAERARRHLSAFCNVEIVCARFEDWNPGASISILCSPPTRSIGLSAGFACEKRRRFFDQAARWPSFEAFP